MAEPTPAKRKIPAHAPKRGRWYRQGQYIPWRIFEDVCYRNLTPSARTVYESICHRSTLTNKNHRRRYITTTHNQISALTGLSTRTVARGIKEILRSRLAHRWHRGTPETGGSRYEIPASLAQVFVWRVAFTNQGRRGGGD